MGGGVRAGRWAALVAGLLLAVVSLSVNPAAPAYAAAEGYLDVTVQGPDGSPLGGATVIIYKANEVNPNPLDTTWRPAPLNSTSSGPTGVAHFVQAIPPGQSVLQVKIWVEKIGFVGEWYQSAATYADANAESISDGVTNSTPFVALAGLLRIIDVYAYDAAEPDLGLGNATLGLYDASGDGTSPSLTVATKADGTARFTLPAGGLPSGLYRLRASRAGYLPQWYLDPPGGVNDFDHAFDIDLTGEQFALDFSIALTAGTPQAFTAAPKPTISGTLRKGKTLTAKPGTWVPKPSLLAYTWYRGARKINGATAKTYTLKAADVGKRISVKVKGTLTGYVTTTRASAKTAAIKP